jgi:electron transfer flavoprotein alpha/beta subunit
MVDEIMHIVVCIKQVPDTQDIKWTEKGTMIREGVESIMNPYDEYALEAALKIKDMIPDTKITIVTMGPQQASDMIRTAIARGADAGLLVSDRKFAGSDTQATSITLSTAIKKMIPDFDLIVCGQFAIDGDTAQTGPSIAQHLDLPQVTYVLDIESAENNSIIVQKETEEGFLKMQMELPGVICVLKSEIEPRKFTIRSYINALKTEIPAVNMEELGLTVEQVGFKGSPTYVSKSFRPENRGRGELIEGGSVEEKINNLIEKLKEKQVLEV